MAGYTTEEEKIKKKTEK